MIGKKLAELRKARAITQEKLANRLGVSRQAVQKWENDSAMPDIAKLIMISELFGVTIEELLGIDIKDSNNLRYPDEQIPYYEEMEDAFTFIFFMSFNNRPRRGATFRPCQDYLRKLISFRTVMPKETLLK